MIGILAEKPSQARNFAKALSGMSGSYNGEDYIIANSVGHIYEFEMPEKQVASDKVEKYKSWSLKNMPWNEEDIKFKKKISSGKRSVVNDIKKKFKSCDEICIATDVDPTGEGGNLAGEILIEAGISYKKLTRMYFVDESEKEVQKAFKNRKDIGTVGTFDEYLMGYYRSQWDYLSMQFTRIATCCSPVRAVIRTGRLKGAMNVLVGDALKAYNEYQKVPFYENRFKDENGVIYKSEDEPKYKDKKDVKTGLVPSKVVSDGKTHKTQSPPKLLDLASLGAIMGKKGLGSKGVLSIYQKMYEAKILSYPRTEDKTITPEQFNELLPLVDDMAKLVGVDPKKLTVRTPRKTHVKPKGSHGANRPTAVPKSLTGLDSKFGNGASLIYKTLALSTLTMFAPDFEYDSYRGHLEKYPDFVGTVSIPTVMGYKDIFEDKDENSDEKYSEKGLGTVAKSFVHEGFPKKPPYPTQRWLMKQLDKRDIGTGATRLSTYSEMSGKIKTALFVDKKGKILLTDSGEIGYELLDGTKIGNLDTTKKVLDQMKLVKDNKFNPSDGFKELSEMIKHDIVKMQENAKVKFKKGRFKMEQKEKYEGYFAKAGDTVKFSREWAGYRFTDDECEKLLDGSEIEIEASKKDGGTFKCKGTLELQSFTTSKGEKIDFYGFKMKPFEKDPNRIYGEWNGRKISFKKTWGTNDNWGGHTFSAEEAQSLLDGGLIEIEAVSKKGSEYMAKLKLEEGTYNGSKFVAPKLQFD